MRRKSHVRFGGRTGETHPAKAGQGAPVRPLHRAPHRRREGVPRRGPRRVQPSGRGWSIADHLRAELVADALQMATWRRQPSAGQTIAHADHGGQYTSWLFGTRLRQAGLLGSMGSVGDCFDNSVAEAFFSSLQRELLDQHHCGTRAQLATAMFEWIECWYNPHRRHSYRDGLSPIDYETGQAA